MTDASKTPTRLIPFDECIDNLIVRIQPTDADDCAWWADEGAWRKRTTIGPFIGLTGVMKPNSLTVVQAPRLLAADVTLATALAVAHAGGHVLVVDLRDAEIDVVQRIGLVHVGMPELSHSRLAMNAATANDIATRLMELSALPITVAVDRHLKMSDLSSLTIKWALAQSKPDLPFSIGLLVITGVERMVHDAEQWRALSIIARQVRCSMLVALATEERPQADEYRKSDDRADTWIRCDEMVEIHTERSGTYQPVLERCWLRPPTTLPMIVHDPLRGRCTIS